MKPNETKQSQTKPAETGAKQTAPNEVNPNQIETIADVSVPLPIVYKALSQYFDGTAESASVRGGNVLVLSVKKVQEVKE
jgi:hypothetical protein